MQCDELDAMIDAVADGSRELPADAAAHVASCEVCAARLEMARSIEMLLASNIAPAPGPSFTAGVMARIGDQRWQIERVVDFSFNLAIAAGVLVILAGAAGLAWSLGLLSITIDVDAIWQALDTPASTRVFSQLQTIVMAAVLLTAALVLWWWAEAATD